MIQVEGVSKIYRRADGEVRALDDVTMSIEAGEFVVVRGASGSGKSTLLLTIGCMVAPTTGTVRLDGEDVYALSGRQRAGLRAEKIGFVFQFFYLVPRLTALENVTLPMIFQGIPKEERLKKAKELLKKQNLDFVIANTIESMGKEYAKIWIVGKEGLIGEAEGKKEEIAKYIIDLI